MGEEHELNETLVGGELIDRDETPEPSPEMAARVAAARGNSGRSAPAAEEPTAGDEHEEDNSDDTTSREPTDTSVDGLDDDDDEPKAAKAEPKAKDEPDDELDRVNSALDEIERVETPREPRRQPKAEDDEAKGPSVRQAADEIEAERLRKVVEQYGKDDPLVEHLRAMEARHQAQIQAIQAGHYRSEREMHKARLFSEPLEKAAPTIFGDRESRAKNTKQARVQARAYEAAAEATTVVAEAIISDAARRNPLVAKLQPHHIAGMFSQLMTELAGLPSGAAAAGAAERKKIAATLAARQANAGVSSRPSGADRVKVPQTREEAKTIALDKFRNKRARNARK